MIRRMRDVGERVDERAVEVEEQRARSFSLGGGQVGRCAVAARRDVGAAAGALAEGHDPKPERFAQAALAAAARYDITAIRTEFEADQKKENPDG